MLGEPPPPPPGVEPVRGPRGLKWLIVLAILLVIVAASNWIPVPIFFALQPGPVKDVEELVHIDDAKTYSSEGRLLLTTVNVDDSVTLKDWVSALFDPETTIVPREEVTGGGSLDELLRRQRIEMAQSKQNAEEVALTALGIAEPEGNGAEIQRIVENSPAADVLKAGDIIIEVNQQEVSTTCSVGRLIDETEIGEELELTVMRAGERETVSLVTKEHPQEPGTPFIGVVMRDLGHRFDPGFEVEIETGEIGGPSAGLMFALALYDRLTAEDLTHGLDVAGTGTIGCDGGIGGIGGIEQKIAGAEAQGAEIFLTPARNVTDAEAVADELEIVAVSTFDDAVEYLENLPD